MPPLINGSAPKHQQSLVPFASRLKEGRALATDVWTIYKSVFINFTSTIDPLHVYQCCQSAFGLH